MLASDAVQALAAIIYGHHAGLPNSAKLVDADKQPDTRERYGNILPVAQDVVDGLELRGDVRSLFTELPQNELQMEVLQRMLFSALVDADFLDTETHFEPGVGELRGSRLGPEELWEVLQRNQETLISKAEEERTPVNEVRQEVYRFCLEASGQPQGVFRLGVPTGGGKTRSGLAFALHHAAEHGLDRVIVAVPYT